MGAPRWLVVLVPLGAVALATGCGRVAGGASEPSDDASADASSRAPDACASGACDAGEPRADAEADAGPVLLCGRSCARATCAGAGAVCGPIPDGCGGLLDCGACPASAPICLTSSCADAPPPCAPKTCAEVGVACGPVLDGCGGVIECGACPAGLTCGATAPGQCGPCGDAGIDAATTSVCGRPCAQRTCAASSAGSCLPQSFNDGCGGAITCAPTLVCAGGLQCCGDGACYATCPTFCLPVTCHALGVDACGVHGDGCGGVLDCGACPGGEACAAGRCGACPTDGGVTDAR